MQNKLRALSRALRSGDISKEDYAFEVSLAKRFSDYEVESAPPKKQPTPGVEVELEVKSLLHTTKKAWLVITEEFPKKRWFPMSRCELDGTKLTIPQWLYNKLLEEQDG